MPTERHEIQALAAAAGRTVSTYLLRVGLGYRFEGILDNKRVEELSRVIGDMGRLGGLLKLWLTDDPQAAKFGVSLGAAAAKIGARRNRRVQSAVIGQLRSFTGRLSGAAEI